jgi:hypothetical protein
MYFYIIITIFGRFVMSSRKLFGSDDFRNDLWKHFEKQEKEKCWNEEEERYIATENGCEEQPNLSNWFSEEEKNSEKNDNDYLFILSYYQKWRRRNKYHPYGSLDIETEFLYFVDRKHKFYSDRLDKHNREVYDNQQRQDLLVMLDEIRVNGECMI